MDMILECLLHTRSTISMELSAKSLECLETFRKRVFESDEHVRMVGQETMDMLLQKTNQSPIPNCSPFASASSENETEDAKCQYGLSALFLQSARHGFESEELKYSPFLARNLGII